jgi:hypothetical protein
MADTIWIGAPQDPPVDLRTYLTPIGMLKVIGRPAGVGEDYQIPGYVGAIPARLGRGPRSIMVGGLILGKSTQMPMQDQDPIVARYAYQAKLEAFASVVFQEGEPFQIQWDTSTGGDTPVTVSKIATARYLSGIDDIEQLTPWAGRVAVEFSLLTPFWE